MKNIEQIKMDILDSLDETPKITCSNCEGEFFPNRHNIDKDENKRRNKGTDLC